MRMLLALALLATGMLLLGCTYSANYSYNGTVGSANKTPPAQGTANETTAPGGNAPPAQGTANETSNPPTTNETAAPSNPVSPPAAPGDLSGKNYTDLLLSGFASQCTSTLHILDKDTNLKLYFDGKGNMTYLEGATGLKECPSAIMVYKGDLANGGMLYATCPGHESFLGSDFKTDTACAWRSMNISAEYGGIGSSSLGFGTENETYSTPLIDWATSFDCQPWTPDGSKFDVKGFVCD